MPAYGTFSTPTAIYQGDSVKVWNNETPAAGAKSERVAIGINQNVSIQVVAGTGTGPPPAFSITVQVADVDKDAAYADTTAVDLTGAFSWLEVKANFVRLLSTVAAAGPITAMISITQGGG